MPDWLRDNLNTFIAWSTYICVGLMIVSVAGIWHLGRGKRFLIPETKRARRGSIGLLNLFVAAAILLLVLNGPMRPLSQTIKSFDHGVGEPPPDLSFKLVSDNSAHHLGEFRGKVVVLNLWATYCPPCIEEIPMLNQFYSANLSRGVIVVTLSDEPRDLLLKFIKDHPMETVNGYRESLEWVQLESFRPFTLIIDRNGVLREYVFGPLDYEFLERRAHRYL